MHKDPDTGVNVIGTWELLSRLNEHGDAAEEFRSLIKDMDEARDDEILLMSSNMTYVYEMIRSYIDSENNYLLSLNEEPIPNIVKVVETYDVEYTHSLMDMRRKFRAKVITEDNKERIINIDHQYYGSSSYYEQADDMVDLYYEDEDAVPQN